MRQIFKQLLLPATLAIATQISSSNAEVIRVLGPNGEVRSAPQFSEQFSRGTSSQNQQPSRFYGPTGGQETLWSIASALKPSPRVTVQQTLYAIYQLNPQAFEDQNIHSLIPGSSLRVPSLAQVQNVTVNEAVRVMEAHQAKLDQAPTPVAPPKATVSASPSTSSASVVETESKIREKVVEAPKPPVVQSTPRNPERPADEALSEIASVAKQLDASETEVMALEEKNHQLRLMLSDVQGEVDTLKDELNDEARIRDEVERLLSEERQRLAEQRSIEPTIVDQLLSNTWLVAALASIPGLMLGLIIVLLLGRRSAPAEDKSSEMKESSSDIPAISTLPEDDSDDDLDEDLFGDINSDDDLFSDDGLLDSSDSDSESDDIFASLEDDDLDFNLEGEDDDPFASIGDDGDFAGLEESANGISVDGEDKALGLEEMERALDEMEPSDPSGGSDFDLSDAEAISQDDIEALLEADGDTEDLGGDSLDQSLLDNLFDSVSDESEEDEDSSDQLLDNDFDIDALIAETSASPEPSNSTEQDDALASLDDIDDIFAQVQQEKLEAETDEVELLDESIDLEDDDIDALINANNTDLLDEVIDDSALADTVGDFGDIDALLADNAPKQEPVDEFDSLIGLDEPEATDDIDSLLSDNAASDSLDDFDELIGLDEDVEAESSIDDLESLLSDSDSIEDEFEQLITLDDDNLEDSASTLDELLDLDVEDDASSVDETALLDEMLNGETLTEDFELDSDSTEMLDELLQDETEQSLVEQETEGESELNDFDDLLASSIDEFESKEEQIQSAEDEALGALDNLGFDLPASSEIEDVTEAETKQSKTNFDRNDFIDDMLDIAPASDPLFDEHQSTLDESDQDIDTADLEDLFADTEQSEPKGDIESGVSLTEDKPVDFDFDPVSESGLEFGSQEELSPEVEDSLMQELGLAQELEPEKTAEPQLSEGMEPNEFGIPQDDDWVFDEEPSSHSIEESPQQAEDVAANAEVSEPVESALEPSDNLEPEAIDFDDLDLPTFDESDAFEAIAEEPAKEDNELVESALEPSEAQEPEAFDFDDLELPTFDESDAFEAVAEEPETEVAEPIESALEPSEAQEPEAFDFDDLELPTFDESDAFEAVAEEPETEVAEPIESALEPLEAQEPEAFDFDDLELPTFDESDAFEAVAEELVTEGNEPVESALEPSENLESEAFDFDDLELPTFDESDAFEAFADEPFEPEMLSEPEEADGEQANIDDLELPEFGEEQAKDAFAQAGDFEINDQDFSQEFDTSAAFESELAPVSADNDLDALHDIFATPTDDLSKAEAVSSPELAEPNVVKNADAVESINVDESSTVVESAKAAEGIDEQAINDLLSDQVADFEPSQSIDDLNVDSAGMDFEAMLSNEGLDGDDWSGFSATAPENNQQVTEQVKTPEPQQFMTIDELMAQVESEEPTVNPDEEELKLDVGLNEFPDVIGDIGNYDVDENAEASSKLDLAKIYIEMNDPSGARKLLEEAIVFGSDDIRREAKTLIDKLDG